MCFSFKFLKASAVPFFYRASVIWSAVAVADVVAAVGHAADISSTLHTHLIIIIFQSIEKIQTQNEIK